ncbi:hypothetical protein KJ359_008923 [Pestalotiopsis sp. 9143b]|nr:hypothetical protein KJ359_008923 [Pestalotiopsis sp. 9143b]
MDVAPDLDIPDLNKRVPPFLSWLSHVEAGNERNVNKGFKEGIIRTESKLTRAENRAFDENLMEELYQALDDTDAYSEAGIMSFDEFEQDRRSLYKSRSRLGSVSVSSLSTEVLNTVEEYFDVSLRVLESFVSPQFRSTLVGKYLAALSMIMKDPTQGLHMRETNLHEDPELSDNPDQVSKTRWVISRTRIREDGLKYRGSSANELKCSDCNRGVVYDSLELAIMHLRGRHVLGSAPEDRLRLCAIPEASALLERRREDQHELLQTSRNSMAAVLQKLVYIQDGVTYDDEFREQRGLPHQLLDSLRWIVVYICTVPHIFHQIAWFYEDDLPHKATKHLTSSKIRKQMSLLSKVGLEAEDQVRKAERALISPTSFSSEQGPESFLVSVGPHYLATQIVGNLLSLPVLNQKHASDVYNAYTSNLRSQILRRPSKRQILKIGALNDDLDLVRKFYEWQRETVRSFDLIASPATYSKKAELYAERERLFAMEYEILLGQDARLEKNMQQINKMIDLCDWMVEQIRQRTEIMKDDQSQVIFIFTTVTVVFLPLSFVASYVSMGSDETELDWRGIQVLFWTVAGPLTVVVIIFCLVAAKRRTLLQIVLATQWTRRALEWKTKVSERATWAWSRMGARLSWRKKNGEDEDDTELIN